MRKCIIALVAALMATPASAAVVFELQGVTFNDGSSASGSFTTTDDFSAITDFSITTSPGETYAVGDPSSAYRFPFAGHAYNPLTATAEVGASASQPEFLFTSNLSSPYFGYLSLNFSSALMPGENLITGGFEATAFLIFRSLSSGMASSGVTQGGAVPEPATWAMMLFGFGAVGFAMRRRRKQNVRARYHYA